MENSMNMQSNQTLVTLLGSELDLTLQIQWAVRLANVHKLDVVILHRLESSNDSVEDVLLDGSQEVTGGIVAAIRRVIEEDIGFQEDTSEDEKSEICDVQIRLKLIHFTSIDSLRRTILAELRQKNVALFTQARVQISNLSDIDLIRERRLLLRYIPCKVVICLGLKQETKYSRILVASGPGQNGSAALQLGAKLAQTDGALTALHVNPSVGVDAMQVGERRLERYIKRSLDTQHSAIKRQVVVDNQINQGIHRVWKEEKYDLIVMGVSESNLERSIGSKLAKEAVVVLVSTASPFANMSKQFLDETLQLYIPQIERESRVSLVDRVQSNAAWNFDFIALMVLATIMASIGLIQNSAAVVIGAMLVAPLMTPIIGLGLALVQGNLVLAGISLRSVVFGVGVSLLVGFLVGFHTPGYEEPTREMLARGGPSLLDMLVAFAAGVAAAYASSRPGLVAALPGVAIAAALVPPIATSGLALALGELSLAFGALLLFAINMVTITLASMLSLWAVGFRNHTKKSSWNLMGRSTIFVTVLILGLYLTLHHQEYELTESVPAGLIKDVQKRLGSQHQLDDMAVAYDELGVQLNLHVVGKAPMSEALASEVRNLARDHYNRPVRVRLMTRIEIQDRSIK